MIFLARPVFREPSTELAVLMLGVFFCKTSPDFLNKNRFFYTKTFFRSVFFYLTDTFQKRNRLEDVSNPMDSPVVFVRFFVFFILGCILFGVGLVE